MEILKTLTKFCVSIFLVIILSSCCVIRASELSPFPPAPNGVDNKGQAVLSFDSTNNVYIVKPGMVENATLNQRYIDNIHDWKRENNIR